MPNDTRPTPPRLPPALQDLIGPRARWHEMQGGRTNMIWRVEGIRDLVVKCFAPDRGNPLFPNDPQAEATALSELEGYELAPQLRGHFTAQGQDVIVYDYVPGTPLAGPSTAMFAALTRLHRRPPPRGLRHLDISPKCLIDSGDQFLSQCHSQLANDIRASRPVAVDVPSVPPVFLHGDAIPANAVDHESQVTFIDWQCPAIGDPTFDLAVALSPAMQHVYGGVPHTHAETQTNGPALDALWAYDCDETRARFMTLRPFYAYQMAAYCAWKAEHGEPIYADAARAELKERDRL